MSAHGLPTQDRARLSELGLRKRLNDEKFWSREYEAIPHSLTFCVLAAENRRRLFADNSLSDVDVRLDGDDTSFPAHLSVLVWMSSFFFRMIRFRGLEHERLVQSREVVLMRDSFSPAAMPLFLEYLYTGKLDSSSPHSGDLGACLQLYQMGHLLDDDGLRLKTAHLIDALTERLIESGSFELEFQKVAYLLSGGIQTTFRELTERWLDQLVLSSSKLTEVVFRSEARHRLEVGESRVERLEGWVGDISEKLDAQTQRLGRIEESLLQITELLKRESAE